MKKLVVLTLLLAAGMLWAQAAAPAAPWSDPHKMDLGLTLDYMWAQDLGAGKEFSDRPIIELKFNWVFDEFTVAYLEMEEGPLASRSSTNASVQQGGYGRSGKWNVAADRGYASGTSFPGLDRANFTTDLGKALKLPVPVTIMYGLNEFNGKDGIKVTKSEYEDWLGEADIRTWGAQLEVMPSPAVTLRASWAWNPGAVDYAPTAIDPVAPTSWYDATSKQYIGNPHPLYLFNVYGTVAPITYELTYFSNNSEAGKGLIEGGLKFVQDMNKDVNVAAMAGFMYDLQKDPYPAYGWGGFGYNAYNIATGVKGFTAGVNGPDEAPDAALLLQVGAQVMYQKMAALGLSYRGAQDMLAGAVQVQGWAMPIKGQPLELLAQIGLGLDSDVFDKTFDSLEIALRYTTGKVQWYLGYYFQNEFGRAVAKEWADFDLAGVYAGGTHDSAALFGAPATEPLRTEASMIFMRGKVAL